MAVPAVDAVQRVMDHRLGGGEGVPGEAVVLADGGEALGEVIGDGCGCCGRRCRKLRH